MRISRVRLAWPVIVPEKTNSSLSPFAASMFAGIDGAFRFGGNGRAERALEVQRICSAQAPGQWRLVLPLDAPEAPSSVHAPDCLLCLPPLWLGPPAAHAMVLAPASAAPAAPRREPWALAMVGALPQARAPPQML